MTTSNLRVLHVLPSLNEKYGGPLRLVLDLSARSEGRGLISEVLGVGSPSIRDNPLHPSKIHSVSPGFGGQTYAYSPQLRKWLAAHLHLYDGVVIHGAWTYPGWAAAIECQRIGVPYAGFPHGMLEQWAIDGQGWVTSLKKRLYWRLREQRVWSNTQSVFFTTALERQLTCPSFRVQSPGVVLPPYGIESEIERVPQPRNQSLMLPSGLKVALFLGRLHPKKNVRLLIEAWCDSKVGTDWRLVIAGSGAERYENELLDVVRGHNAQDRIVFAGFVAGDDKAYLLQRADWFLLPSSQENFGVAVLEAVQHGCAVAISDRVYLAESMRPDSEVIPATREAWAEFFRTRMQDPIRRQSVRDMDYAHLLREFGMDHVVQGWISKLSGALRPSLEPVSKA